MKKHNKLVNKVDTLGEFVELAFEKFGESCSGSFVHSHIGLHIRDGDDEDYWDD